MKIIRVMGPQVPADIDFHPDSALLLPGRPLFYPDFGGDWEAHLFAAVHLNRLGKGISEKFASRYYDGVSIGVRILPKSDTSLPAGVLSGLDSSITHGEWLSPADLSDSHTLMVGAENVAVTYPTATEICRAVSHISTCTTLRMGDILLLPLDTPALPISPRSRLIISLPSTEILNLKIV